MIPQLIINKFLVLSFQEFTILNESGLLDKLKNNEICTHIRFYNSKIVYYKKIDDLCIYCYSQKKIGSNIIIFFDYRNYFNEENHYLLFLCENNFIKFKIYDYENPFYAVDSFIDLLQEQKNVIIIDNEVISFKMFFETFEKKFLNNNNNIYNKCMLCEKKLNKTFELKKCINCKEQINEYSSNKYMIKKINPNNFIEKLKLKKNYVSNQSNSVEIF